MTDTATPSLHHAGSDEPVDHVILIPSSKFAWSVCPSAAAAAAKVAELKLEDPEKFAEASVMTLDAFVDRREQSYLAQPIVEIDEARFGDALDCLPPLDYQRQDGVSRFCMSEFTDGAVTQQYAQMGDRFFTKPVRFRDRTTYLIGESITAALAAGAVQAAEASA